MTHPTFDDPLDLDQVVAANRLRDHQDTKLRNDIRARAMAGDPMCCVAWAILKLGENLDGKLETIDQAIGNLADATSLTRDRE